MIKFLERAALGLNINLDATKLKLRRWGSENFLGILSLNVLLMMLILLRSAGYFEPFLSLSINLIVLVVLLMSKILLKITSQHVIVIALAFIMLAAVLKLFVVDIWAERSMIYSFEALSFAIILMLFENSSWRLKQL